MFQLGECLLTDTHRHTDVTDFMYSTADTGGIPNVIYTTALANSSHNNIFSRKVNLPMWGINILENIIVILSHPNGVNTTYAPRNICFVVN